MQHSTFLLIRYFTICMADCRLSTEAAPPPHHAPVMEDEMMMMMDIIPLILEK